LEKLKTSTSLIALKIWVEGKTDLPVYDKLLRDAGETNLADTLDVVGGWPMLSNRPPERWLDGCREAIIIMDGDSGRRLNKRKKPYTTVAKKAFEALHRLPIKLYVLERYGIENYFTRGALEAATGRDLSAFVPIPHEIPIEDHLVDNRRWLARVAARISPRLLKMVPRERQSFYRKEMSKDVANHLMNTDVDGTDLGNVLREAAAQYLRLRTS
jgi:hypothetical protein